MGISYGIYDPPRNHGTVCIGVSHDTPAFAAHSIATWWKRVGLRCYGRTPKLLVLADSGGSNSCTSWAWKTELQTQLCNPFGIAVTIAHYPTGASKSNPIEHRLFSEISKNWAAEPRPNNAGDRGYLLVLCQPAQIRMTIAAKINVFRGADGTAIICRLRRSCQPP